VVLPHIHVGDAWLQQSLCWVLLSPFDESQEILVVDDDEWLMGVEGLCERPHPIVVVVHMPVTVFL